MPPLNPSNNLQEFLDINTINLSEITSTDLLGINGIDYERYLQDGRTACTVVMDGASATVDKKEILRKIKDQNQCRSVKQKEDNILTSMSELKL